MIIFKTESWGGCDGLSFEKKYFLKEELARKEAKITIGMRGIGFLK